MRTSRPTARQSPAAPAQENAEPPLTPDRLGARLWRYLNREGIAYCVVGANRNDGGDIDIVVGGLGGPGLIRLMQGFCEETGVQLVQVLQHERSAWYFVLAWTGEDGAPHFLHPDVCGDYVRDGRTVLDAGELLAGRAEAGAEANDGAGYPVPAPAIEFVYYLVKKIDKQALADRHGDHLSAAWRADPRGARIGVARFWPDTDAALIARAAADDDWGAVRAALPRLRRSLRARLPWTAADRWRELKRRIARAVWPSGLVVAVLGPDGAGKSSVIERLVTTLAPAFRQTHRLHLRPRLGASGGSRAPIVDPHGEPPRGAIASAAKLLYFLFDYWAGYAAKLWPLKARSSLVLFDRYYHDLLADPKRYRYGAPPWLAALAGRLVPEPDLTLILDAPAETLQARKREVLAEESARQRAAYRDLAARLENAVVIDAGRPPERVAADAAHAVVDHLAERMARRVG
ncbi:MAG: dTMP kinase [Alphaproteobacteria bacterium]